MDPIWRFLPNDLVLRVLEFSDEIETRIAFRIRPRKLGPERRIEPRPEIVYDHLTRTMWDFTGLTEREQPYWITRKGLKFSQYRGPDDLYVFNMGWEDYDMTMYSEGHVLGPTKCRNHIVLNKRVKFR